MLDNLRRSAALVRPLCVSTAVVWGVACTPTMMQSTSAQPLAPDDAAELWGEPGAGDTRDLFWGPGGRDLAPRQGDAYRITGLDETGHSRGYDAVGPDGREWKIKIGDEAQSEVVASRVLWAIGFHQPPTYALESWKLDGGRSPRSDIARFRLKDGYRTRGEWSWQQNPFVGMREFNGLLVVQILLNNWDLKTSNNRIYVLEGDASPPRRRFVVQDLGAALGASRWPIGTRNNVAHFERQAFIKRIGPRRIEFDYAGRHRELFHRLEPGDVVWACSRLARITDGQWADIFRAARYDPAISQRFIAKLRSKIREGLAMIPQSGTVPPGANVSTGSDVVGQPAQSNVLDATPLPFRELRR